MRWAFVSALLLLAAWPAAAQDGCDSGIEEDSQPKEGEEPEPAKREPEPTPPPEKPPEPEKEEPGPASLIEPTPEDINRAIDKGVAWLKQAQRESGSFGPCVSGYTYGQEGGGRPLYHLGPTAFAIFTLATCGVPRDDPVVRRGLAWLEKAGRGDYRYSSYESSAVILMLGAVNGIKPPANPKKLPRSGGARPPKGIPFRHDDWTWMDVRIRHLIECVASGGGFGYWDRKESYSDVSATQFAILALRSASFAGYPVVKVRPDVWTKTAGFLEGLQAGSGGFPYHRPHGPSRGMTAAGLSSLLICREQLGLVKEGEPAWIGDGIAKGLAYLDADFEVTSNPSPHCKEGHATYPCYLYALERTGILSGRREFAGKDWYMRGAAHLLEQQASDGSWTDRSCMEPKDTLGTCFALLFLKRATPPAVTVSGD